MARYCKAYKLEDLRKFPKWAELAKDPEKELENDFIVYIQESHIVTKNPLDLDNEDEFIFDTANEEWEKYCANELSFSVPTEEELSPTPVATQEGTD